MSTEFSVNFRYLIRHYGISSELYTVSPSTACATRSVWERNCVSDYMADYMVNLVLRSACHLVNFWPYRLVMTIFFLLLWQVVFVISIVVLTLLFVISDLSITNFFVIRTHIFVKHACNKSGQFDGRNKNCCHNKMVFVITDMWGMH